MSENREDDAREGGSRIEELPASDSEVAGGEQGGGARGGFGQPSPGAAAPPEAHEPEDPTDARRGAPPPDPGE